jgi:deoxyribonuclease-4
MKRLLGAHVSVAGGLDNAFARGIESGCTALQIFTKNANRWQAKPISDADASAFRKAWQESGISPVMAHDAYLINLASPKEDVWEKSKNALRDELIRCAQRSNSSRRASFDFSQTASFGEARLIR